MCYDNCWIWNFFTVYDFHFFSVLKVYLIIIRILSVIYVNWQKYWQTEHVIPLNLKRLIVFFYHLASIQKMSNHISSNYLEDIAAELLMCKYSSKNAIKSNLASYINSYKRENNVANLSQISSFYWELPKDILQ